jgi:hypothetical protein
MYSPRMSSAAGRTDRFLYPEEAHREIRGTKQDAPIFCASRFFLSQFGHNFVTLKINACAEIVANIT